MKKVVQILVILFVILVPVILTAQPLPYGGDGFGGGEGGPPDAGAGSTSSSRSNSFGVSLDMDWEIDLWGRVSASARASIASYQASAAELDARYASAMKDLARKYPDDIDAAVLYAESLMDLQPWDYWTEDLQPKGRNREFIPVATPMKLTPALRRTWLTGASNTPASLTR